jgi:hypothetical protein
MSKKKEDEDAVTKISRSFTNSILIYFNFKENAKQCLGALFKHQK